MIKHPFLDLDKPRAVDTSKDAENIMATGQWRHINDALYALPLTSTNPRLRKRFALPSLYTTCRDRRR